MIAAALLLIVFFGLAQIYNRGRVQLDYEEDRRKATAVLQDHLDGIRRDYTYDNLMDLDGTTVTYTVDNRTFTVTTNVSTASPEAQATTLHATVTWTAMVYGTAVTRVHECTTVLGRGMPWPS
jgi:hypothetical protein